MHPKTRCLTLIALVLLFVSAPAADAQAPAHTVVYYFPDSVGENTGEIVDRYQRWIDEELAPALGYELKVRYFSRMKDLEDYVELNRGLGTPPLFGALHAEVAMEKRTRWGLALGAYPVTRDGARNNTISVVVRRDSTLASLADMRGKTLIGAEYWGADAARFERLAFASQVRLSELAELKLCPSSSSAVMGVYFRSADAGLVSSRVFDIMESRTSAIWQNLKVIHQSSPMAIGALVFFSGTGEGDRKIIVERAVRGHKTPSGKSWLDYVHLDHLVAGDWTDLFAAADLQPRAEKAP